MERWPRILRSPAALAGRMIRDRGLTPQPTNLGQDALQLQGTGISNPTVRDTCAVCQLGVGVGAFVAKADDTANIDSIVGLSAAAFAASGLTASSTDGDWRSMQVKTLGVSAGQVVIASQ